MKNKFFLSEVFRHGPAIFSLFLAGILLQCILTYKQVQLLPVFHYGMYARPIKINPENCTILRFYSGNQVIDESKLSIPAGLLSSTASHYYRIAMNGSIDPIDDIIRKHFPASYFPFMQNRLSNTGKRFFSYPSWAYSVCKPAITKNASIMLVTEKWSLQGIHGTRVQADTLFTYSESEP